MRIVSGIQPSGKLHLGNYFGAVRQFVELQEKGEAFYFLADLHALTSTQDAALMRSRTLDMATDLLALGVDPQRATLFLQSEVPAVSELYWILGAVTPMGLLERGHGYKDKLARGMPSNLGLFAYPVLMAADILIFGADVVPVGQDQKQHLEFARDIAGKFNQAFVPGYNPNAADSKGLLRMPEPMILESTGTLPGLDGRKMSKSYGNTIDLFADDRAVQKQIRSVVTDSAPVEAPKDPETSTLFTLLSLLAPDDRESLKASFLRGGTGYGAYKQQLVDAFHARFDEARERRRRLAENPGEVRAVLEEGSRRARAAADRTLDAVRAAVGLR